MTKAEAQSIVGRPSTHILQNMAFALSLHSWNNTADDWTRLHAAVVVLGRACPKRARAVLNAHITNAEET